MDFTKMELRQEHGVVMVMLNRIHLDLKIAGLRSGKGFHNVHYLVSDPLGPPTAI